MIYFNPHPASWLGATFNRHVSLINDKGFNPHPTSWPGATPRQITKESITHVSTLTQPHGRVQRASWQAISRLFKFQPSPSLMAGCNHGDFGNLLVGKIVSTLT